MMGRSGSADLLEHCPRSRWRSQLAGRLSSSSSRSESWRRRSSRNMPERRVPRKQMRSHSHGPRDGRWVPSYLRASLTESVFRVAVSSWGRRWAERTRGQVIAKDVRDARLRRQATSSSLGSSQAGRLTRADVTLLLPRRRLSRDWLSKDGWPRFGDGRLWRRRDRFHCSSCWAARDRNGDIPFATAKAPSAERGLGAGTAERTLA